MNFLICFWCFKRILSICAYKRNCTLQIQKNARPFIHVHIAHLPFVCIVSKRPTFIWEEKNARKWWKIRKFLIHILTKKMQKGKKGDEILVWLDRWDFGQYGHVKIITAKYSQKTLAIHKQKKMKNIIKISCLCSNNIIIFQIKK